MMITTSGKITEFNERGFRIVGKGGGGDETQIAAPPHEYEGLLQVGDEVQVYGGPSGSGRNQIFLTSYISVFRNGEWLRMADLRKDPPIKLGKIAYFVIFGSLILALAFLAAVILMWWFILR